MFLDMRTVFIASLFSYALAAFFIIRFWRETGKRYPGLIWFLWDFMLLAAGNFMILLRGMIPLELSIMLGSPMVLTAMVLGLIGLGSHFVKRIFLIPNLVVLFLFFTALGIFTFPFPDLRARDLVISTATFLYCGQCAVFILLRVGREDRSQGSLVGISFLLLTLTSLLRFGLLLTVGPGSNDLFEVRNFDAPLLLVYQFEVLLLAYSLILMITRRLGSDLKAQENKFAQAFHSSPDAVMVTGYPDGTMLELNDAFMAISGWSREEALGKTTIDMGLWPDVEVRRQLLQDLSGQGILKSREIEFVHKDGHHISALLSGCLVRGPVRDLVVSNITDITERSRRESRIVALLEEKKLLLKEIHHRVKNNLNVVFGLLVLQSEAQDNQSAARALAQAAGQVKSMTSLYDRLYLTDQPGEVSIRDYLEPLSHEILALFPGSRLVAFSPQIADFPVKTSQASVLGLILNELVTNSFKYAFPLGTGGTISLSLACQEGMCTFAYQDSGPGIKNKALQEPQVGFGLGFILVLVRQLGGEATVSPEGAAEFSLQFSFRL